MKIDQKQILIYGGIALIIITVILIYLITKITPTPMNYDELEVNSLLESKAQIQSTEEIQIPKTIKVHIAGSVITEGIVELEEGARIADAIEAAGGTTPDSNMQNVNLAYKIQDGQKIYIPNINDEPETEIVQTEEVKLIENGLVNINTATQTELELLTGIGPSTAAKIIEYREQNGKFTNIEEIKEVPRNRRKQICINRKRYNSIDL